MTYSDFYTQRERVGYYIELYGVRGINKKEIERLTGAEDVPTRVWELIHKEGWIIGSRKSKINKCQDYIFISKSKTIKSYLLKPRGWIFDKNGIAREAEEPKQESFLYDR